MKKKLENYTILFTDLVDSTKYKQIHGHKSGLDRILLSFEICEKILCENNGIIVKNTGDGLLVHFNNPIDAVEAVMEIEEQINESDKCKKKSINLKYAITIGIVENVKIGESVDIFGTAVDRCARILSLAKPNQVLIENSIFDILESHHINLGIEISDPFECNVKNYEKIIIREISRNKNFNGIEIKKYPDFVLESQTLLCDTCGCEITNEDIERSMALLTFDESKDPKTKKTIINDVYFYHKGNCDRKGFGWRDLSEFAIPELYLDLLLTIINQLVDQEELYTNVAKKKLYKMFFRLYPFVFRQSDQNEKKEFELVKNMLEMGF